MTNYLENISLLKQLEPIMKRLGVEADKYYNGSLELEGDYEYWIWFIQDEPLTNYNKSVYQSYKTYRSDTLENVLPDWCWHNIPDIIYGENSKYDAEFCEIYVDLLHDGVKGDKRGQPKLEALAKLVILLDENGLLEEKE